jgi:hypothetical protein
MYSSGLLHAFHFQSKFTVKFALHFGKEERRRQGWTQLLERERERKREKERERKSESESERERERERPISLRKKQTEAGAATTPAALSGKCALSLPLPIYFSSVCFASSTFE